MKSSLLLALFFIFILIVESEANPFFRNPLKKKNLNRKSINFNQDCPFRPTPSPIDPNNIPIELLATLNQIEVLLKNGLNESGILFPPGVSANLIYNGEILWQFGAGTKQIGTEEIPDGNTIFRIGSCTKIFVAIMAYQMADIGVIRSLDDPISAYANKFSVNNPYTNEEITFRQVLSQLSGLPREVPCIDGLCDVSSDEIFRRISNLNLQLPPWSVPSYSNLGFALLGDVMASMMGISFGEYVQGNILNTLGMNSTGYNITSEVISRMAVGYNQDGSVADLVDLGWVGPAGQMWSTTNDMATLIKLFLGAKNDEVSFVLPASFLMEMMNPVYLFGDDMTVFASPFESIEMDNYLVRSKGGNINGYSALFSLQPELGFGMSILWNGDLDEGVALDLLYSALIPTFVQVFMQNQPLPNQPSDPQAMVGQYIAEPNPQLPALYLTMTSYQIYGNVPILSVQFGENIFFPLNYAPEVGPGVFQVVIPPGNETCFWESLSAIDNIQFIFNTTTKPPFSFTIPAFNWGYNYTQFIWN